MADRWWNLVMLIILFYLFIYNNTLWYNCGIMICNGASEEELKIFTETYQLNFSHMGKKYLCFVLTKTNKVFSLFF